jgi:HlyD family secretion protein
MVEKGAHLELESAQSKLQTLNSTSRLKKDQARAQFETAQANQSRLKTSVALESAQKSVDRVRAKLEFATVRAPEKGQVVKIFGREGEGLGSQPLLQIADTEQMYVNAEVYETDLQRVKVGQKVTMDSAALPQELHGEVEKVLWTVAREGLRSLDPTSPSDLRVVAVKVRLDKAEVVRFRDMLTRLINLQVDVYIEVDKDT